MNKAELLVTVEVLRSLLDLDAFTGLITWKARDISTFAAGKFSAEHLCANWNSCHAGKRAFAARHPNGYLTGGVNYQRFLAHRVAFALYCGRWPVGAIDHINGDKKDNRIANLREVDHEINAKNQKLSSRNSTGVMGVSYDKRRHKFFASIQVDGKTKALGRFETLESAALARAKANAKYGFHHNHGRIQK